MTAFLSGGHNPKGKKIDPGAVGNGKKEADIVSEFRDLVISKYKKKYPKEIVITDKDSEILSDYLKRIQTGSGSVVLEFHCDASVNKSASGCTAIVGADSDRVDKNFASELVNKTSEILSIKNRGVINEADSHRGRLGLMREQGTVALLELFFISNQNDLNSFEENKEKLADALIDIIYKYEKLF